jgi:hypothetical protein
MAPSEGTDGKVRGKEYGSAYALTENAFPLSANAQE